VFFLVIFRRVEEEKEEEEEEEYEPFRSCDFRKPFPVESITFLSSQSKTKLCPLSEEEASAGGTLSLPSSVGPSRSATLIWGDESNS